MMVHTKLKLLTALIAIALAAFLPITSSAEEAKGDLQAFTKAQQDAGEECKSGDCLNQASSVRLTDCTTSAAVCRRDIINMEKPVETEPKTGVQ